MFGWRDEVAEVLQQRIPSSQRLLQLADSSDIRTAKDIRGGRLPLWRLNGSSRRQHTPLAAAAGSPEDERRENRFLISLLAAGVDVDKSVGHSTPLELAVNCGHVGAVHHLLQAGADANRPGGDGVTPLMRAVAVKQPRIVQLLLLHGGDVDARDKSGRTAVDMANVQAAAANLLQLLHEAADMCPSPSELCEMARFSDPSALYSVVQGDIPRSALNLESVVQHETPLKAAAGSKVDEERGNRFLSALLQRRADANKDCGCGCALQRAIANNNVGALRLLLDAGAIVNRHDRRGVTPLMQAARLRDAACAELLLEHGADADAKDFHQNTVVSYARAGGADVRRLHRLFL